MNLDMPFGPSAGSGTSSHSLSLVCSGHHSTHRIYPFWIYVHFTLARHEGPLNEVKGESAALPFRSLFYPLYLQAVTIFVSERAHDRGFIRSHGCIFHGITTGKPAKHTADKSRISLNTY